MSTVRRPPVSSWFAIVGGAGIGVGLMVSAGSRGVVVAAALSTVVFFVGIACVVRRYASVARRAEWARLVLWAGLAAPLAVTQTRTAQSIAASPLTALNIVQGGLPFLAAAVSYLLVSPKRRPLAAPEMFLCVYLAVAFISVSGLVRRPNRDGPQGLAACDPVLPPFHSGPARVGGDTLARTRRLALLARAERGDRPDARAGPRLACRSRRPLRDPPPGRRLSGY